MSEHPGPTLYGRKGCGCGPCRDRRNETKRVVWRATIGDPAKGKTPVWVLYNCTPTRRELLEMRDAS